MSVKFCLVYTQFIRRWEELKNQTDRVRNEEVLHRVKGDKNDKKGRLTVLATSCVLTAF
jgi:hypothetical protein